MACIPVSKSQTGVLYRTRVTVTSISRTKLVIKQEYDSVISFPIKQSYTGYTYSIDIKTNIVGSLQLYPDSIRERGPREQQTSRTWKFTVVGQRVEYIHGYEIIYIIVIFCSI